MDSQATRVTTNIVNDDKNRPKPKEKSTRKRLNYGSSSANGPLSSIESYIAHQKQKIKSQEAKIESLEEELAEYTAQRMLPSTSSLPCCSKCHRKEGHNRLNCPYPMACSSALFCGNIDKHPDDKQTVKQKTKQLTEKRKSLEVMKEELKNREKSSASVPKRYTARVKETLIKSNPEKYFCFVNGIQIEDWRLINQDSKILEKEFKGKIPTAEEARETIEEFEDQAFLKDRETVTGKTSVRNPYKKLWQDRGISWPHRETKSNDDSSLVQSPQRKRAAVMSPAEENDFHLAMAMQESLDSLPNNFNSENFEQNTSDDYSHNIEGPADDLVTENTKTTSLEVLANAALQLELNE